MNQGGGKGAAGTLDELPTTVSEPLCVGAKRGLKVPKKNPERGKKKPQPVKIVKRRVYERGDHECRPQREKKKGSGSETIHQNALGADGVNHVKRRALREEESLLKKGPNRRRSKVLRKTAGAKENMAREKACADYKMPSENSIQGGR